MSYAYVAVAVATAISAGVSYNNGQQQAKASKTALNQAKESADKQAMLAEQDMNAANKKRANTQGLLSAAMQAGRGGASGTMLTGPQGVDPKQLLLGKSTLLGG